jgi:Rod binding domain-containing protein
MISGQMLLPERIENLGVSSLCKGIVRQQDSEVGGTSDQQKKQVAKDFESILIKKLLDEMKSTIGDWGFERDGASEQVQGLFWMYLSRHLADNGGLGLCKDMYRFLANAEQTSKADTAG